MSEEKTVTEVEPEPKINSFVVPKKGGEDNIPRGKNPFYVLYQEGMFLHVKSDLGTALVKVTKMPSHLKSLGAAGYFEWDASRIPSNICSQIVDFFRNVYDEHKTEAGVILLMNYETKEWSVFVPTQKVSGTSVDYVYEPSEIPEKHMVVGTMHSHCNFSAFHSGTDKHDADGMNGVHLTIGHLDREEPEIVSMVSWNGTEFTYKPEQVADFSNLEEAKAPAEWYANIIPSKVQMTETQKKLFNLYGEKPTSLIPYQSSVDWDNLWESEPWYKIYQNYNSGYRKPSYKKPTTFKWENHLEDYLLDVILESDLLTDDDWANASESPGEAQLASYWTAVFLRKLSRTVTVLDKLGYNIDYHVKTKKYGEAEKRINVIKDVIFDLYEELTQEENETKTLDGDFSLLPD